MAKRKREREKRAKSITRMMTDEAREYFSKYENDVTRKTYNRCFSLFVKYCRQTHPDCKSNTEAVQYVQEYADHLMRTGYTASTIHTYIAAVCSFYSIDLDNIKKPRRHTADNLRGRSHNDRFERNDNDLHNPKYARLVEFQRAVGIRRSELKRLRGNDITTDEDDHLCVIVKRGKGGKYQLQRILPYNEEFVKSYFDGKTSDEKIFSSDEMKNKLNLHSLRAECARNTYYYHLNKIKEEGEPYREKLKSEIIRRWNKYNINPKTNKPKRFPRSEITGTYYLRGKNRAYALKNNLPTGYDKLVTMYVSIFCLSHYRLDVTVDNYFLAF